MQKIGFQKYCANISRMAANVPDWNVRPSSIIEDYVREDASYGCGLVLTDLLGLAHGIVERGFAGGGEADLGELAGVLSVKCGSEKKYKFNAYYFAVAVLAVALNKVTADAVDVDGIDENELMNFDDTSVFSENADPTANRLKKFGIRLLDFSRRNNKLVHFEPTKNTGFTLSAADFNATLKEVANRKKIYFASWDKVGAKTICRCRACGEYGVFGYDFSLKEQHSSLCPNCDRENGRTKSMVPLKEKLFLSDGQMRCQKCGEETDVKSLAENGYKCPVCGRAHKIETFPIVTKSDLLNLKSDEVICEIGDTGALGTAKNLINKAAAFSKNFGLHVLYLACGFLKWRDKIGVEYLSPLLLCPINLYTDKATGKIYFESRNDGIPFEANKTLSYMLASYSKDCSISLPMPEETGYRSYFKLVEEKFANVGKRVAHVTKDWEVVRKFGIGFFRYQKIQLHDDLERYENVYLSNPVIRRLCGDTAEPVPTSAIKAGPVKYTVLDADSSQEEVIDAAREGKSFILQGPPGSGKSQTITNIITTALGDGKTVLFVTEKATARSVIMENLNRRKVAPDCSLTDFVLDFGGFPRRSGAVCREPFVEEINRVSQQLAPNISGVNSRIAEEEKFAKEKISEFMRMMKEKHGGKSYLDLLREAAKYAKYGNLVTADKIPDDPAAFADLCDYTEKYYIAVATEKVNPDYRKDALYGCKGDRTGKLLKAAQEYLFIVNGIGSALDRLCAMGWNLKKTESAARYAVKLLTVWRDMPILTKEIIERFDMSGINKLIAVCEKRRASARAVEIHEGRKYESEVDKTKHINLWLDALNADGKKYACFLARTGEKYRNFIKRIDEFYLIPSEKHNYATAAERLNRLNAYVSYARAKHTYDEERKGDFALFGSSPVTEREWSDLLRDLNEMKRILSGTDGSVLDGKSKKVWLQGFVRSEHEARITEAEGIKEELAEAMARERELRKELASYFDGKIKQGYEAYRNMAETVIAEKERLAGAERVRRILEKFENEGWIRILNEMITEGITTAEAAKGTLMRAHAVRQAEAFAKKYGKPASEFDRFEHEGLLERYAKADEEMLASGAKRLYSHLKTLSSGLPKLASKTGYSIKRTITENREHIRKIKPCFMMSPLDVSEYIDIDVIFDLVIFDEASQIFTEDALATVVRGKQVIIVGDSKQLPPCDFFRAGDASLDDDENYYEEETNAENSFLTAADKAMCEASIQLNWHYRSCDEALIAFSNTHMDYNLISFPSAVKNPDDGIEFIGVPYAPETCYVSGKGGSHINSGEADKVVELIWREITHPTRRRFSLGVVAFSNAQAQEIERRWELFAEDPTRKPVFEQWEKEHPGEPLAFCNLDTMQGDERDTMILSICYGTDANGRFTLPYLGRLRLENGKKRINVAITRARHRMTVVSTLTYGQLKSAIDESSAPEENKSGARMLCEFLKYAEGFKGGNDVVTAETQDAFAESVCEVLAENGIEYSTEVGRSACKIDIAVKDKNNPNSFRMGIIIDNPGRSDFDSPREYSRLTESVLEEKYNWKIYRIYPIAWLEDFEGEKKRLLKTLSR